MNFENDDFPNRFRFGNCFVVGPTGPTERLFKSSNKIIIDSS